MSTTGIITIGSSDFPMLKYIATYAADLERTAGFEKGLVFARAGVGRHRKGRLDTRSG